MPKNGLTTNNPTALLTTHEAAEHLNISPRTLEKWRLRGVGPVYLRFGRAVRYNIADLDLYRDSAAVGGGAKVSTAVDLSSALSPSEPSVVPVGPDTIDAVIDDLVSAAPTLSSEQRSRLASLVGGA